MKLKRLVTLFGMAALAVIVTMACSNGSGDDTPDAPKTLTYTVEADGTSNTASSTALAFVFSEAVSDLSAADITLAAGSGSATKGELTGSGKDWSLAITVTAAGTVTVSITKDGIESGSKTVSVHKQGEATPTTYTVTANGTSGTVSSTALAFVFSEAVSDLSAADITLAAGSGSATKGELTGTGQNRSLAITVTAAGTVTVSITKDGIESGSQTVSVHKQGETTTPPVPAPTTNAQHLAMLQSLGVNTTTPDLPVAPNGASYNPQTSSSSSMARAASGPERSLGPLGKIYSQPLREIFVAGYAINGKNHALFQDFKNSTMTRIGQAEGDDTGWAGGTGNSRIARKSVAADLDGDGIDEVVIVALKNNKMLIYKGAYNGSAFTITHTQAMEHDLPATVNDAVLNEEAINLGLPLFGWELSAADLNGDGKQECILTLPGTGAAYMYVLDNNLSPNPISLTPYYTGLTSGRRWFPMATAADYDQDGKDELCLMIGMGDQGYVPHYYILDDKDAGYKQLSEGIFATTKTNGMRVGRPKAGDFNGDGLPDTVFYGTMREVWDNRLVMLLETSLDTNFKPKFTWLDSANFDINAPGGPYIPQFAVGDVDGDKQTDLFCGNYLYTLNADKTAFIQVSGTGPVFDDYTYGDKYDVVMGDVTGDRKDDVVLFHGGGNIQIYYYANGGYNRTGQKNIGSSTYDWETGCLPNVDKDSFILRDTGDRELLFSDPHVIAVLASAPYYAGINEDGNGGTYFGESKSSGSGSSNSFGYSVGMSIGFEFEDIFGLSGLEFQASVEESFSWAQSSSTEVSESWGWNNPLGQDLVIFTAIPFDVYYYEVLVPPDGAQEEKGDIITINVPRKPHHYHMVLTNYNALVPEEHRVTVNHTLGEPFSYYTPTERNTLKTQAGNKGLFSTNTKMTAGSGNQSTTISMESATTEESSFEYNMETKVEAKAKAGGVVVGASAGFQYGYGSTSSVSQGTSIEGEVPAIPGDYYTADKDFDWGLMAFPWNDYIFVTYWTDHH
jgi:methionine-rich copper-binding protein CopC